MEKRDCYENYPLWVPLLSTLTSLAIYITGAYIIGRFGILWAVLYLVYCGFIEFWVLKRSCVNCYYYGKICAFGKGKLCASLFKQGDSRKFAEKEVKWYDLLPDFMVIIIPLVVGITYLALAFNWIVLVWIILQVFVFFVGTAVIRGSLACKHCKQGELGCPAAKAFFKE